MADQIVLPDNLDELIEEAGKPQLPEGRYLAIIVGGEAKTSDNGKLSYGVTWKLLVNNNPDSIKDGWDTEAATTAMNYVYTYIGAWENEEKKNLRRDKSPSFVFTHMMSILGVSGNGKPLVPSEHKFRQIVVRIKHEPDQRDPDVLRLAVGDVYKYVVGEDVCPVLAGLAEAYEEMHQDTVKELDDVFGEGSSETPVEGAAQPEVLEKKKRTKKEADSSDAW